MRVCDAASIHMRLPATTRNPHSDVRWAPHDEFATSMPCGTVAPCHIGQRRVPSQGRELASKASWNPPARHPPIGPAAHGRTTSGRNRAPPRTLPRVSGCISGRRRPPAYPETDVASPHWMTWIEHGAEPPFSGTRVHVRLVMQPSLVGRFRYLETSVSGPGTVEASTVRIRPGRRGQVKQAAARAGRSPRAPTAIASSVRQRLRRQRSCRSKEARGLDG